VIKSGPGWPLLFDGYERTVIIGQTVLSVAPMYTLTPWSVLDCFRNSRKSHVFFVLLTAISLSDKWQKESYEPSFEIRNHISQSVVLQ